MENILIFLANKGGYPPVLLSGGEGVPDPPPPPGGNPDNPHKLKVRICNWFLDLEQHQFPEIDCKKMCFNEKHIKENHAANAQVQYKL